MKRTAYFQPQMRVMMVKGASLMAGYSEDPNNPPTLDNGELDAREHADDGDWDGSVWDD